MGVHNRASEFQFAVVGNGVDENVTIAAGAQDGIVRNPANVANVLADGDALDNGVSLAIVLHELGVDAHEEVVGSLGVIRGDHGISLVDRGSAQAEGAELIQGSFQALRHKLLQTQISVSMEAGRLQMSRVELFYNDGSSASLRLLAAYILHLSVEK